MKFNMPFLLSLLFTGISAFFYWAFSFFFVSNSVSFFTDRIIVGVCLFLILQTICIYYLLHKTVFKPLHQLAQSITTDDVNKGKIYDNVLTETRTKLIQYSLAKNKEIEKLKRLEEYRKEFLGDVSHELKTPIFNIQGFAETIIENEDLPNEKRNDFLKRIAKNADRLHQIVQDLLLISQVESGMMRLDPEPYNLREQIEEVLDHFQQMIHEKRMQLSIQHEAASIMVFADKQSYFQVLINIISNAIKYGRESGFVTISVVTSDEDTSKYIVEIADNGVGISVEHISRIFERFYRIDKARSRDKGGTGLGLSIVKHLLEANKEKVWVESRVGIGTTFYFTIKKVSLDNDK